MEIECGFFKQIEDAKIVIRNVLQMDIGDEMKRKIIDVMLWNITGAFGKLNTKFVSEGSLDSPIKLLRHEHVFTKKSLIERIMSRNGDLDCIIQDAIACIVTKAEHEILHINGKGKLGWDRYKNTAIKVFELDDEIAYRKIPELRNREFMTLPKDERDKILDTYPLVVFLN
jgi:hypothetical protein